jgi:hypothetical protein
MVSAGRSWCKDGGFPLANHAGRQSPGTGALPNGLLGNLLERRRRDLELGTRLCEQLGESVSAGWSGWIIAAISRSARYENGGLLQRPEPDVLPDKRIARLAEDPDEVSLRQSP